MKLRAFVFQLQRELLTFRTETRAPCYEDALDLACMYARDKGARVLFFDETATRAHPEGARA